MADWSLYDRGFSVFPLAFQSKRPALESWEQYQTIPAAPPVVQQWAAQPLYNVAVATGAVSGCIVVDCDDLLARVELEERGLPPTFTVSTPRGTHFYFQHPGWPVSNRAGRRWGNWSSPGIDLRGDGGYVVGPGSFFLPTPEERAKGKVEGFYSIEHDSPLAAAPDWLLELILPKAPEKPAAAPRVAEETSAYGRAAMNDEIVRLVSSLPGEINNQINLSAFAIAQLVAGGEVVEEEGWGAIEEALAALGVDGEEKANGTARRGWEAGLEKPRAVEHREALDPLAVLGARTPSVPPAPIDAAIGEIIAPAPPPLFRPLVKPQHIGGNEMMNYFAGCVYIGRRNEMFLPSGVMVKPAVFDALYGGPAFFPELEGGKASKSAWSMFNQNAHVEMPKVWDICFRPELPPGQILHIEGLPYLNIYVPISTPRAVGDASPFVNHVRKMLPEGRDADILIHYLASCVQNPGRKFFWWPVIQGTKGNGKTLLLEVMFNAIGERYSHLVRADSVIKTGNQFNDWLVGKLFLGFEEIRSSEGKRDFVEIMKDTVTNARTATEGKGAGQSTSDNRANGVMLSNYKDACPIDDDERRWGVLYCAQQEADDLIRDGMDGDYFPNLYNWLRSGGFAVVTHYLATFPLEAELDPAQKLHRAPETSSTVEAIFEGLGLLEQEILECIETEQMGFRGGVMTTNGLRALFDRLRKTIAPKRYAGIVKRLGYATHPSLAANKGRPNNALPDGSRPVLYFAKGHEALSVTDAAEIKAIAERCLFGEERPAASNVVPLRR